MKRFACPSCRQEVHFENSACLSCGSGLGYAPERETFLTLPETPGMDDPVPCANRALAACNWLVAPMDGAFCIACRHNRTVPDVDVDGNAEHWRDIEQAKRYLFYSILKWDLPRPLRDAHATGLAFDFLADTIAADGSVTTVLTGHEGGLITLNIAEGNDVDAGQPRPGQRTDVQPSPAGLPSRQGQV